MTNPIVEFYRAKDGEIRWRRMAANGRIIAISGEGFQNWNDAYDSMLAACTGLNGASIVDRSNAEPGS